jgi:hypothetical protein
MKTRIFGLIIALILALTLVGTVFAQDGGEGEDPAEPPAEPTTIEGVVVAVDPEAGTITLADGTVITVGGSYEHPIVDLLSTYFGGGSLDLEALAAALETIQLDTGTVASVVCDETTGVCTATLTDGTTAEVTPEEAEALQEALDALNVSMDVVSDGETNTTTGVGDDMMGYLDSGIGFGELVKLYAIVAECQENANGETGEGETEEAAETEETEEGEEVEACDLTVDFLIGELQSGVGMGELFELYGKPSLLGVGHVRQALRDQGLWSPGDGNLNGDDTGETETEDDGEGICNARSHGGNANAHGQGDVVCP